MQQFDLRDYIKLRRTKLKISLNQFAFQNEMEPATLSRLENKKFDIKYLVLKKIANGFGLTPAEFLTEYEKYCKNLTAK